MLTRIRRRMFPVTLSAGLVIVNRLTNPNGETSDWYTTVVNDLIREFGNVPVTDVTPEMMTDWHNNLKTRQVRKHKGGRVIDAGRRLSVHSVSSFVRAIEAYFNKLVMSGHMDHSPAAHLKPPRLPKKTKREVDIKAVKLLLQYSKVNLRDHAIIHVLYDSACRISELLSMTVDSLTIGKNKKGKYQGSALILGKGDRYRYIYFKHKCCKAILRYLEVRPVDSPNWVWLSHYGGRLARNSIYPMLRKYAKAAGVEGRVNPHSFRHAFAKRLIRNGADIKLVSDLMGHESGAAFTLDQYVNYDEKELADGYERFS